MASIHLSIGFGCPSRWVHLSLWVADALGSRVCRVAAGGKIVDSIRPDSAVFACMLGGTDGRTLFFCCAPGIPEHARCYTERVAEIRAVTVDVPHAGLP